MNESSINPISNNPTPPETPSSSSPASPSSSTPSSGNFIGESPLQSELGKQFGGHGVTLFQEIMKTMAMNIINQMQQQQKQLKESLKKAQQQN